MSIDDARAKMGDWHGCHSEERPYSGIDQDKSIKIN
jgi:hypothetical protein